VLCQPAIEGCCVNRLLKVLAVTAGWVWVWVLVWVWVWMCGWVLTAGADGSPQRCGWLLLQATSVFPSCWISKDASLLNKNLLDQQRLKGLQIRGPRSPGGLKGLEGPSGPGGPPGLAFPATCSARKCRVPSSEPGCRHPKYIKHRFQ
jgi:hypothetical protein